MPQYTGHDIADAVRNIYLNRAGISDTAMLPIINAVYESLQETLIEHGAAIFSTTFAPITVAALATSIPYGTGIAGELPNNFVGPLKLYERAVGGLDTDYIPMEERDTLPFTTQDSTLRYWSWNEEAIKLIGATGIRQVLIKGYKFFPMLDAMSDSITISYAKGYLAAAVAAQAALSISHNPTLAIKLDDIAEKKLAKIINRYVKKDQSLSIRRRGYRRPMRHLA